MKSKLTLLLSAAVILFLSSGAVQAEEATRTPAPTVDGQVAATEIAAPDAGGVIPSLAYDGDITDLLKMLGVTCHKNIVPSRQVRGPVTVNLFDVTCREILEAVLGVHGYAYVEKGPFIFVYTQKELEELEAAARQVESRTFELNYISAADAQVLLEPLMSDGSVGATTPDAGTATAEGAETWAGQNYIVVVDYPDVLEQMEALLRAVDRRPAQVLVDATILVAKVTDNNSLGIDMSVLAALNFQAGGNGQLTPGGAASGDQSLDGTATSVLTGFTSGIEGGLAIGIVKNDIGLFIKAVESVTDVVTLGSPKIMTLNRQQGRMHVGRRDGYVTTEQTATATVQTIEFLDSGTTLTFRPFVTNDNYIRMELNPKQSTGEVKPVGAFVIPSETTAEVTTNVMIKDGQTIVIGGLFRDTTTLTRTQIPLVGNIPLLGQLFRGNTDTAEKEEVIFLITPHIVEETTVAAAGAQARDDCDRLMLGIRKGLQWHARDRLAEAHYRLAKGHQAAGRPNAALWEASLATHMSPIFLDALQLRDELRGGAPAQAEYGPIRLLMQGLLEKDKVISKQ